VTRESGPKAASQITAAKQDQRHSIAQARAVALATDLSAVAEGVWSPSQTMLDALTELAWATAFDLAVAS
jgi:hypothetical protein